MPAVRLFVERAAAPSFALTQSNAAAVAAICRRLDGLPLAIELAAARVKVLSPAELLARLEQHAAAADRRAARTRRPGSGRCGDAIAWSYDLLDPDEQALFRRLAVFAGGFTLEAAEAVAVGGGAALSGTSRQSTSLSALDLRPRPRRLAGRQEPAAAGSRRPGEEPRFEMLETIREYGLERLTESGEADAVRDAHAAYFLALAEASEAGADRAGPGAMAGPVGGGARQPTRGAGLGA